MKQLLVALVLALTTGLPASAQTNDSTLASIRAKLVETRAEAVRSRGFIRGAETQLSKTIAKVDSTLALVDAAIAADTVWGRVKIDTEAFIRIPLWPLTDSVLSSLDPGRYVVGRPVGPWPFPEFAVDTVTPTVSQPPAPVPPVLAAKFGGVMSGLTVELDGTLSTGDVVSWEWDLGVSPGQFQSGPVVTVTYPHTSVRTVKLTVRDAAGNTSTASETFTVTDPEG